MIKIGDVIKHSHKLHIVVEVLPKGLLIVQKRDKQDVLLRSNEVVLVDQKSVSAKKFLKDWIGGSSAATANR